MSGLPEAATPVPDALAGLLVGLDHIGLAVEDLDEAVVLWSALGWSEYHRETNDEQGVHEAMLRSPAGGGDLQLLASARADSAIATFIARRGVGVQQVAFEVTDVNAAIAACAAAGIESIYPAPRRGTGGRDITFLHPRGCGGVLVELIGPRR